MKKLINNEYLSATWLVFGGLAPLLGILLVLQIVNFNGKEFDPWIKVYPALTRVSLIWTLPHIIAATLIIRKKWMGWVISVVLSAIASFAFLLLGKIVSPSSAIFFAGYLANLIFSLFNLIKNKQNKK